MMLLVILIYIFANNFPAARGFQHYQISRMLLPINYITLNMHNLYVFNNFYILIYIIWMRKTGIQKDF